MCRHSSDRADRANLRHRRGSGAAHEYRPANKLAIHSSAQDPCTTLPSSNIQSSRLRRSSPRCSVASLAMGLLLPPVLAPMLGPEAVVPVISVSALISNTSRLIAFRKEFDCRRAAIVSVCAVPTCAVGAYGYTLLSGPGVAILLGTVLIVLVP